jgi:hypothetical protein
LNTISGEPRAQLQANQWQRLREALWSAAAAATAFRPWFIREMGKSRNKRRHHILVMVMSMNDWG